jgi:hypothetical protein
MSLKEWLVKKTNEAVILTTQTTQGRGARLEVCNTIFPFCSLAMISKALVARW